MPKVLFLGASWFQLPPIEWARAQGYGVVTADNRPSNPGHALADRAYTVSTVDVDGILDLARAEAVDGVVAYASDVSAPTAARVAAALGLPGNPVEAVETLCDKARFREFQRRAGFPCPGFVHGTDGAALRESASALRLPLVVKPVDASGSKGVTLVRDGALLGDAIAHAIAHSRQRRAIVEEHIARAGCQLTGDGFVRDGRLVFRAFANEHFCAAGDPCAPVGESLPAEFDADALARVHAEVQRYLDALGLRRGALNFDILLTPAGEVRVIEIGPRCGGNHIPWLIRASTGVDLARAVVEDALGRNVDLDGDGVAQPCASLNLVDLLAARGLRHVAAPHRLAIAPALAQHIVAASVQTESGGEVAFAPDMTIEPARISVGFLLFRLGDPTSMLAAMSDLASLVQIRAE